eukprot:GHVO01054048.1.p1 GENE.GHVO01054048.1~~GHVO01054048.1.p1  ORF type:complete len:273 (+),score=55.74 GHVO01054048.1:101-919(+)
MCVLVGPLINCSEERKKSFVPVEMINVPEEATPIASNNESCETEFQISLSEDERRKRRSDQRLGPMRTRRRVEEFATSVPSSELPVVYAPLPLPQIVDVDSVEFMPPPMPPDSPIDVDEVDEDELEVVGASRSRMADENLLRRILEASGGGLPRHILEQAMKDDRPPSLDLNLQCPVCYRTFCPSGPPPPKPADDDDVPSTLQTPEADEPVQVDNASATSEFRATRCGHVFCSMCIKRVLESTRKRCPLCSRTISNKCVFPLFLLANQISSR